MRALRWPRRSVGMVVATAAITGACSSSTELSQRTPALLEAVTATSVTGTVGAAVSPAPVVRVKDRNGNPVEGVLVTFLHSPHGGEILTNSTLTDPDGLATPGIWTLGTWVTTYSVTARSQGLGTVVFVAMASTGPLASMTRISGSNQIEMVGSTLPLPLRARVTDSFGNPVAGAAVTFTVSGGGSLAVTQPVSDADGEVSGVWTLGPEVGQQMATARIGIHEVEFVAEAYAAGSPPQPLPPSGSMLAFVSERDGNSEIYVVNDDGTGLLRLTNAAGSDRDPAWSPDGKRIAFTSDRAGGSDIFVMDADGSNLVRRTQPGWSEAPAWSPDGTRIAFSSLRNGQFSIHVMQVDGDWANPTRIGHAQGWETHAAWSPDGSRIAFVSDWRAYDFVYDIYVMDADGSNIVSVIEGPFFGAEDRDYFHPTWSPDGKKLAVTVSVCVWANNRCDPMSSLAVANADGSQLTTLGQTAGSSRATWSRDGSILAFGARTCLDCGSSLRYVSVDGSRNGEIFSKGHSPAWRP